MLLKSLGTNLSPVDHVAVLGHFSHAVAKQDLERQEQRLHGEQRSDNNLIAPLARDSKASHAVMI